MLWFLIREEAGPSKVIWDPLKGLDLSLLKAVILIYPEWI